MQSIKQKILLVTLLPAALLMAVLAGYLLSNWFDDLDRNLRQRGESIADLIAEGVASDLVRRDYRSIDLRIRQVLKDYADLQRVRVDTRNGIKVSNIGRPGVEQNLGNLMTIERPILYRAAANSSGSLDSGYGKLQLGTVQVTLNLATSDVPKTELISTSLLIALLGLLTLAAWAIIAAGRLAKPIERLTYAALQMRRGVRRFRVVEDQSGELGELQRTFNTLAEEVTMANSRTQLQAGQMNQDLQDSMDELEKKNLELGMARNRALQASRTKSEFLANMSHEIRTPMNGVMGFADLLEKTPLDTLQRDYLATIKTSAKSLLAIINDILDLSKLEADKLILAKEPFKLSDCVDSVVSLMTPTSHEKHVELVSHVYADVPDAVVGDPVRVGQIITNLLNNALKFTDTGYVLLQVMVEEDGYDRVRLCIQVKDSGIGIPKDQQQKIFESFVQVQGKELRQARGTGLGLTITRKLVEAMRGSIKVESKVGQGSTFRAEVLLGKDLHASASAEPGGCEGIRVALIEPFEPSKIALNQYLRQLGCTLTHSERWPESLSSVDLVLLALGTKELSSSRVPSAWLEAIAGSPVPVVALVSSSEIGICQQLLAAGASACRPKPIKDTVLRDTLLAALGYGTNKMLPEHQTTGDHVDVLAGKRVLAADDNPINLKLLEHILSGLNACPVCAVDGQQAVEQADSNIDLIILDIHMPRMNGFAAAQALRQKLVPCPPIIALTADAMKENLAAIREQGFDGVLTKPMRESELTDLVAQLTGQHNAVAEPEETDLAGAAAPLPPTQPLRDRQAAIEIAAGSAQVADQTFADFIASLPEARANIGDAFRSQDWEGVWQHLHRLRGTVAICALPTLLKAIDQVQIEVRKQSLEQVSAGLAEMERLMDLLMDADAERS